MKVAVVDVVGSDGPLAMAVSGAVGSGPNSTAPMSHAAPDGRTAPRWSVPEQADPPASIAGLPAPGRRVNVGPPLSTSGPSSGSTRVALLPTSGPAVKPVAPSALPISTRDGDVKVPATSGRSTTPPSRFAATIVRVSRTTPEFTSTPPASPVPSASASARLPATVVSTTAISASAARAPRRIAAAQDRTGGRVRDLTNPGGICILRHSTRRED